MKLQEYQLKAIFKRYGIPLPDGRVTSIAREARQIAETIGLPVVVKAQVLAEGRSVEGGIRLAKTPEEVEIAASAILSSKIHGLPVDKVLVDEAISSEREYYLLITFDRSIGMPVMMMYDSGNINIRAAANALFDNLERIAIHPLIGLQEYQIKELASCFDFPQKYIRRFITICKGLWQMFCDMDATMVAVNPIAITDDNRLLALDGLMTIDDNAYFRQNLNFDRQFGSGQYSEIEYEARKYGMYYFKLNGNVGCLMNGAGLTMSCIDYMKNVGVRPANYLDLGGSVFEEKVNKAMEILYMDSEVDVILVGIYGGKTHCDAVAKSLLSAVQKAHSDIPIIAFFNGNDAEEACQLLEGSKIRIAHGLSDAIGMVMETLEEIKWAS